MEKINSELKKFIILWSAILLIFSCDRTYSLRLVNLSTDTIKVSVSPNSDIIATNNQNTKPIMDELLHQKIFSLAPNKSLFLGLAIAELDTNDIVFNCLRVFMRSDSTVICGKKNILNLFEKKEYKLKRPYEIILR